MSGDGDRRWQTHKHTLPTTTVQDDEEEEEGTAVVAAAAVHTKLDSVRSHRFDRSECTRWLLRRLLHR